MKKEFKNVKVGEPFSFCEENWIKIRDGLSIAKTIMIYNDVETARQWMNDTLLYCMKRKGAKNEDLKEIDENFINFLNVKDFTKNRDVIPLCGVGGGWFLLNPQKNSFLEVLYNGEIYEVLDNKEVSGVRPIIKISPTTLVEIL